MYTYTHRIHGAAIYGNMDPINIPPMLAYIPAPWILWDIYIYMYIHHVMAAEKKAGRLSLGAGRLNARNFEFETGKSERIIV